MPRRIATRTLVESALLVAIATMLCVLDAYVPVFALVYPLPIVVLIVRRGVRAGVWATLVTIAATSMFVGPFQGISVFGKVGIIGITLAWCLRKKLPPEKTLAITAVAVAVSMAFVVWLGTLLGGFSLAEIWDMLQKSTSSALGFYRGLGVPEAELSRMEAYMSQLLENAKILLPASLLVAVVAVAGSNYLLARLVLRKLGYEVADLRPFSHWRVTWPFGWGYIGGIALTLVGTAKDMPLVWKVGANIASLFSMVFLVQGAALCWYFIGRYRVHPAARALLVVFVLFNPTALQILSWVGLFDAWFDFRKLSS